MITLSSKIKKETLMFFKKKTEKKRDERNTWRIRMSYAFLSLPLSIVLGLYTYDTANALANPQIVLQTVLMFSLLFYPVAFMLTDVLYDCYRIARKRLQKTPQQKRNEYLEHFKPFRENLSATERLQIEHYIQDTPRVSEKQVFLKIRDIQKSLTFIKKS